MPVKNLGDKALFWGTIGSFAVTAVGFTAWLTHVDYTASSVAQAQEKNQSEVSVKLDGISRKLDDVSERLSHLEGAIEAQHK